MNKRIFRNKRAVSIMIGYVLLISAAIVMGAIVYQWMKSYVPKDALDCPDGVSIIIEDVTCVGSQLSLTLKNNGRFDVGGYFIHATDNPSQELASIDLSDYGGGSGGIILFQGGLKINDKKTRDFDLKEVGDIYSIEITPVRFQVENNKNKFVNCGNAKIKEEINCINS